MRMHKFMCGERGKGQGYFDYNFQMAQTMDTDTKDVKVDPPSAIKGLDLGSGLVKHLVVGSVLALLLGGLSKYYFSYKNEFFDEPTLSEIIPDKKHIIIDHQVQTKGTFGEETQENLYQNENIVLEGLPQEDPPEEADGNLFNIEQDPEEDPEEYEIEEGIEPSDGEEEYEEEDDDEGGTSNETLGRLLTEDVQLELDDGFLAPESQREEGIEVSDDPEIEEYEHEQETEDLTDNNWSDDETELSKIQEESRNLQPNS